MSISKSAIRKLTAAAMEISNRNGNIYHSPNAAGVITAGDHKGASTVACVFPTEQMANRWLERAAIETTDLAGREQTVIHPEHEPTGSDVYIAVLMANDLIANDQVEAEGRIQWD